MFLDRLRGNKKEFIECKVSKFWKRILYGVYTVKLSGNERERLTISSIIHDKSSYDSVMCFLKTHTNVYLICKDKPHTNDEYFDRIFDLDEFKINFTKNKYYNIHSPSERKDSGRYQNDMFIFYKVDKPNNRVLDSCGINRLLHIQ